MQLKFLKATMCFVFRRDSCRKQMSEFMVNGCLSISIRLSTGAKVVEFKLAIFSFHFLSCSGSCSYCLFGSLD